MLAVPTDVADEAQCKALVEKTVATFDRLDLLVNNAGLAVIARLEDYSDLGLFQHTMDVNFYGAVYCTYYALPYLIRSRGRIVAVSSLGGKAPLPYNSPYIASKFAMHGFFDTLRIELIAARGECDHHLSLLGGDRFPRGADWTRTARPEDRPDGPSIRRI